MYISDGKFKNIYISEGKLRWEVAEYILFKGSVREK